MPQELVIFQHMPKTAGTSLRKSILANYEPGESALLYRGEEETGAPPPRRPAEYREWYRTLDPLQRERMRLVASHSANCLTRFVDRPFRVLTLFRDPVDRVASLYSFFKWQTTRDDRPEWEREVGNELVDRGWSLADIYLNLGGARSSASPLHHVFAEFFNGQTRSVVRPWDEDAQLGYWAGQPDEAVDLKRRALDLLLRQYVVGVQERYEQSLELFARSFGWNDLAVHRLNVREPEALDPETRELVAAHNELDAELHAHFEAAVERYAAELPRRAPSAPVAVSGPMPVESRGVCVIGPPRSGTSLTTNILNLLGVDLGREDELMPAQPGQNPAGFWEHERLASFNEELLAAVSERPFRGGEGWREAVPPEPGWESGPRVGELRESARGLVSGSFGRSPLWGWKDPRTSLTLPFWHELVPDLLHVICVRHPLDVAASLHRRDGMQPPEALSLWLRYSAAAVVNTRGRPRIVVSYERWFQSWRTELERLARFLNLPEEARPEQLLATVEREIDGRLWHHRSENDAAELPSDVRELYAALEQEAADGGGPLDDVAEAIQRRAAAARDGEASPAATS
jgi:hypothetical protein